jgi:hypothetical protein
LPPFADDMMLYIENPKPSLKTIRIINEFNEVAGHKNKHIKISSIAICHMNGTGDHYVKQNKPSTERQVPHGLTL